MFEQLRPDLVTMDITMPKMDGIECIERMVKMRPDVLILVISALADKATAIDAMKKGREWLPVEALRREGAQHAFTKLLRRLAA